MTIVTWEFLVGMYFYIGKEVESGTIIRKSNKVAMGQVSWNTCWIMTCLSMALYYAGWLLRYCPKQGRVLLNHRLGRQPPPVTTAPEASGKNAPTTTPQFQNFAVTDPSDHYTLLLQCAQEVSALCAQLEVEKVNTLMWEQAVRRLLHKYQMLRTTPYEQTITDLIESEASKQTVLDLPKDEIKGWWG